MNILIEECTDSELVVAADIVTKLRNPTKLQPVIVTNHDDDLPPNLRKEIIEYIRSAGITKYSR